MYGLFTYIYHTKFIYHPVTVVGFEREQIATKKNTWSRDPIAHLLRMVTEPKDYTFRILI